SRGRGFVFCRPALRARDQRTLKFSAAVLPLFETSSNSMACPSLRLLRPALHRRDVNEHVLAAALRLDKAVALGGIKPFHGTCRHLSIVQSNNGAAGI